MSQVPLEEFKLEQKIEDSFWKRKTWEGFKDENNPEVLKKAIELLLDLVSQKQSVIKSLIEFQCKQDLKSIQDYYSDLKKESKTEIKN